MNFQAHEMYLLPKPVIKPGIVSQFSIDTLFYMFYNLPYDKMQYVSAEELFNKKSKEEVGI